MPEPRTDSTLRNISDTALWVAAYRAEESERPDAHFHDPFARDLAGERGFQLLDEMPKGRTYSWPMVVRTALLDEMIRSSVAAGTDMVINLAAGLDARPYRMALPADLDWIEVDLPAMIEYKIGKLAGATPVCRLERVALDLSDAEARTALFARLRGQTSNAMIVTEGLLIYLERPQVERLADDLAAVPSFRRWATDLASPALLRTMARTWGREVAKAGAPFQFAPPEGPAFFSAHGWNPIEIHSSFHAAARLDRLPFFLRLLAKIFPERKSFNPRQVWSGVCLFESAAAGSRP
jgi:methyltransferase (TIGR00027 family)